MVHKSLTTAEIEALTKAFPKGFVALDLETTGLSPLVDRIIEISLIRWTPAATDIFTSFIDPEREITADSTAIHGIDNEMVVGAPLIKQSLLKYLEFVSDLPLVAHNAKFDLGFLLFQLHKEDLPLGENQVYCTIQSSRRAFPEQENYKLATLAETLDLNLDGHHRAEADASACLRLLAKIAVKTPELEPVFSTKDFQRRKPFDLPEKLEGLGRKVKQQHYIEIRYKGGTLKNQWRPVQCLSLLPLPHGSVLYAKCLHSDMYKSFLLHRLTEWREMTIEQINEYQRKEKR